MTPSGTVHGDALLDRAVETACLDAALAGAAAGTGAIVLLEGPAGIGKTSLLTCARERATAVGMLVLHARGSPLEREFAMGVVRQCFEPVVRGHGDAEALFACRPMMRTMRAIPPTTDPGARRLAEETP